MCRTPEGSFCDLVDTGINERVGSSMIPRLWTWVEGVTVEPSMLREGLGGAGEGVWADEEDFRFIAVEF